MDRNTVTGLVLILIVMVAWAYFTMPTEQELRKRQAEQARQDSIAAAQVDSQQVTPPPTVDSSRAAQQPDSVSTAPEQSEPLQMGVFSSASVSDTSEIVVETPLYKVTFTNVGAGPAQVMLKKHETWDQKSVRLIADTTQSAYSLGFLTNQNFNVETDQLVFKPLTKSSRIDLQKGEIQTVKYALNISDTQRLLYTYTLNGNTYEIDLEITFQGLGQTLAGNTIDFGWEPQLQFTEKNISGEASHASAYVYTGGELARLKLSEQGQKKNSYNGSIDWVATRTKFFTQIIKTDNPTQGALLVGEQTGPTDLATTNHHYKSFLTTELSSQNTASFRMYVGPLSYHDLQKYDEQAYSMVDVGYDWLSWISDPLVEYVIIPYFGFIDNYMSIGLGIILFGVLVKMVLYPLTKKSYKSMAAMKELQPEMQEIKEKYADDPEKQQKATMKLYKESGVNPLGGCLPNLLQLPILITLWRFFQNSILIRQQEFLWANDLSAPDYILHLPFSIPFLGDQIAGFVLLMTGAMVLQSKLTGGMGPGGGGGAAGGPNMKALQYIFPFMLLFVFNNFAAGLSLYYLVYNLVSIGQQLLIYRQIDQEKEAAAA